MQLTPPNMTNDQGVKYKGSSTNIWRHPQKPDINTSANKMNINDANYQLSVKGKTIATSSFKFSEKHNFPQYTTFLSVVLCF